jgi:hypothetical protein
MTSLDLIGGDQWGLVEIHNSQVKMDHMPSRMQGFNIEQRDCAVYHVGESYKDCSGGEHITANADPLEQF